MAETVNKRIGGYNLDPPTSEYALQSLSKFLDKQEATNIWESACQAHNILPNTNQLDELKAVFEELSSKSGAIGVVGKSLVVRVNSYKLLTRKRNGK